MCSGSYLMKMMKLNPQLLSVTHIVTDEQAFELVGREQTFKVTKGIFMLVSPFFRSLLRTQPPCLTPQIMIPDVASEPITKLLDIIQHLHDPGYQQTLNLEELRQLDDLFEILKVDTNFFKISIENTEEETIEMDDSYGFETIETIVKDEVNENERNCVGSEINHEDLGAVFTQLDEFLDDSSSSPEKKHIEKMENSTVADLLTCQFCPVTLPEPELITHLKRHLEVIRSQDASSNKQKLDMKEEEDTNASGLFSCQFCPEEFNQQSLINHLKIHVEDISYKDLILVCPVKKCQKNFFYINNGQTVGKAKQIGHLEEHLRAKHTKIPCVLCTECGKEFFSTMALHYHQKQHQDKTRFYCTDCKHFIKVTLKEFHVKKCKRNKYTCPTCSKSFASKKNLEVHEIIHSAEKPFKCKDCPKAFGQKGNLKTHELKMHSKVLLEKLTNSEC